MRIPLIKNIIISSFFILILILSGCEPQNQKGPGFTGFYLTEKTDIFYYPYQTQIFNSPNWHRESLTNTGQPWSWAMHGAESSAPDSRTLPEWIDFKWQEMTIPSEKENTLEIDSEKVHEKFRNTPVKTYRIYVQNKVPQDVIDEILESKRKRGKKKLPKKALNLYFTWVGDEIFLGWELTGEDKNNSQVVLRKDGYFPSKINY